MRNVQIGSIVLNMGFNQTYAVMFGPTLSIYFQYSAALTSGIVACKLLAARRVSVRLLDHPSVRNMTTIGTPSFWRPCCVIMLVVVRSPAAEFVPEH